MSTPLRTIIPLAIVATFLVGYNFLNAAWNAPTATPPNGNTDAPLNTSSVAQTKTGALIAGSLTSNTNLAVSGNSNVSGVSISNIFAAYTEMRSNRYCDRNGFNCYAQLPSCAAGKILVSAGTNAAGTTGWTCADMTSGSTPTPGSPLLVNGQHTEAQCTSLGGIVVGTSPNKFCRFDFPSNTTMYGSCPVGWSDYNGWAKLEAGVQKYTCGYWPVETLSCNGEAADWGTYDRVNLNGLYQYTNVPKTTVSCRYKDGNDHWVEPKYSCTGRPVAIGCY